MSSTETYRDVIGYKGLYKVSNFGNVKSLERKVFGKLNSIRTLKERVLKNNLNKMGYYLVGLMKDGNQSTKKVHQLVAEAFLGHNRCGMNLVVDHIDNDKLNNYSYNLQIIPQRENANLKHIKSSSKYVGVSFFKRDSNWTAGIQIKGKKKHLGYFKTEYEAHLVYQKALKIETDGTEDNK